MTQNGSLTSRICERCLSVDPTTRVVTLPTVIMPEVQAHIEVYAQPGSDGMVFVGPKGAPLRRPGSSRTWDKALRETGLVGVHFHDLRHAGNTLAAMSGANRARSGHGSNRRTDVYPTAGL